MDDKALGLIISAFLFFGIDLIVMSDETLMANPTIQQITTIFGFVVCPILLILGIIIALSAK